MEVFIVALITSVLAGLGIGGGGLLVIYLAFFTDTPQITSQGINLLFFIFSSAASMLVHLKRRRLPFLLITVLAVTGGAGAALGSITALGADQSVLRRLFGAEAEKCRPLLAHDVADPWYTGNFDETWADVLEGCSRILEECT